MELVCFDFINSQWSKNHGGIESLTDEQWIDKFLDKWELPNLSKPEGKEISTLLELRSTLTNIVEASQYDVNISEEYIKKLNYFMSFTPVYREIKSNGNGYFINNIPSSYDWNWIINLVAGCFSELICYHDIKNIKICENPDCKFVFYDKSKNHSKRWCCNTCRSLIKVRKFRAK